MHSSLDNIQQLLYAPDGTRYLVLSRARDDLWEMTMWTSEGLGALYPRVWSGSGDVGQARDNERGREVADAILGGMLSVQMLGSGELKLLIHIARTPVSVFLSPAEPGQHNYVSDLLSATFNIKEAKPATTDERSIRAHQVLVNALQAEIVSLQSRNANLKAQIQRQTGSSGRKDVQPMIKPVAPPKNASVLQPTQRKRKVVEDEFMGSSDEDDGDDDSEEEYREGD
ncbi:hypothetical protein CspeluHIS016_0504320 [Cutaneotrichosporon spelunceum]|uniref:Uncharacterized protein n=1 Tax=Cutaneotrichosporon spelunceum TaxID=1672016 RepID=A0AAD3YCR4_9TREE|nr:hypothetical protein CspeluHIS016_0504320 [Cutaneotrichosporon spelunceum]